MDCLYTTNSEEDNNNKHGLFQIFIQNIIESSERFTTAQPTTHTTQYYTILHNGELIYSDTTENQHSQTQGTIPTHSRPTWTPFLTKFKSKLKTIQFVTSSHEVHTIPNVTNNRYNSLICTRSFSRTEQFQFHHRGHDSENCVITFVKERKKNQAYRLPGSLRYQEKLNYGG